MKPNSPLFEKIRIRRDRKGEAEAATHAPTCQWDGCNAPGTHRAPVGRAKEGEYFRFCFDHVREYNKGFNYFSGLSDGEIARYQREAMTGHRPTWRMGSLGEAKVAPDFSRQRAGSARYRNSTSDPHDVTGAKGSRRPPVRERKVKALEARALETLGLGVAASGADITARYKELVKLHHPDANGGDRGSEERFRDVLQAYRMLKQAGLC